MNIGLVMGVGGRRWRFWRSRSRLIIFLLFVVFVVIFFVGVFLLEVFLDNELWKRMGKWSGYWALDLNFLIIFCFCF